MRKIKTADEVEKVQRRNNLILGIVLISLLVLSTLGYSIFSRSDDSDSGENSEGFVKQGDYWVLNSGENNFYFKNLPSGVANVSVLGEYDIQDYLEKVVYFVNSNDGANEILVNLGDYFLRYQEACLEGLICEGDLPVKNCSSDNVIIFANVDKEITEVYKDENCVFISGNSVAGADAFLYKILGIS